MNRFQQRAAQVSRPLTWLIVSPLIAVAAYWWLTYSGLYRLLAEWQLSSFHEYYPRYTGIFTILLCLIPAAIAIQIIGGMREKERSAADAAAVASANVAQSARNTNWLQSRRRRLTGVVVTVMCAGAGVYFAGIGLLAGERVSVDAGAIERGDEPGGRWAEITGRLVADDAVTVSEHGHGSSADAYVPLVSPEWQPGQPARVYLKTSRSSLRRSADELASGRYEGMLTANDLPGVAITSFAERGHPAPDRYWVLEYRETPEKKLGMGYAMFGGAAFSGLLTAIGWMIVARRERAGARPSR